MQSGTLLGKAVDFHGAGVGNNHYFRAAEHQKPGAFGKFPVEANHGAELYNRMPDVQIAHQKAAARR